MKTQYFKNAFGYNVVYPTVVIKSRGVKIPNSVLVAGKGPINAWDASSITDQVFKTNELGKQITPESIPDDWREPLGLNQTEKRVEVDIKFGGPTAAFMTRMMVGGLVGFILYLVTRLF